MRTITKETMGLASSHTCFPAGTLVHTDKGLVPIQDIKVGDMVLSRPEWGGRDAPTEYKRVVRAFCSGEEEVVRVSCQKNSEYGDPDALRYFEFMTPNHPIWDETLNDWIPASNIEIGTLLSSIENEDNLRVLEVDMVWDSYTKGIGITYPIYSDESEVDFMVAFNNQGYKVHSDKFISDYYISDAQDIKLNLEYSKEVFKNYENKSWAGNRKPIKVPVYNLEVESFHTYFVGEQAIWVHNDNCFYEYDPNLTFANASLPDTIKFNSHTCFPAGTLVHTDKGLIPIEQLKVGDKVLSKNADGSGELVYKAVTKTMATHNSPIFMMEFDVYVDPILDEADLNYKRRLRKQVTMPQPLLLTANHPLWTENRGWIKAQDLTQEDILVTKDNHKFVSDVGGGYEGRYKAIIPLYQSNKEGYGYEINWGDDTGQVKGYYTNLSTGKGDYYGEPPAWINKLWVNFDDWKQNLLDQTPVEHRDRAEFYGFRTGGWIDPDTVTWAEGEGPLTMTVYNIEVEDTHTYFVGEAGIWVHNCGGE